MSDEAGAGPEVVIQVERRSALVDTASLQSWFEETARELAPAASSLGVNLVGDAQMTAMNKRYRGEESSTDVLSFPGELESLESEDRHLGDIVISIPAARRQAEELGHSLHRELQCLLLHGLLHCMGHDHESDDGTMDRLELELRERLVERREDEGDKI